MAEPIPTQVAEIFEDHPTLTLATSYKDRPWASQVFFAHEVTDGPTIYFASLKPSRKGRHLLANPRVAFAVGSGKPTRWLQGGGVVDTVEDSEARSRIIGLIEGKSAEFRGFLAAVDADFFRLVVDELRVVDLTAGLTRAVWKKE